MDNDGYRGRGCRGVHAHPPLGKYFASWSKFLVGILGTAEGPAVKLREIKSNENGKANHNL